MLKPTKANQKKWILQHLNGGKYHADEDKYYDETWIKEDRYINHDHACYSAMRWLDKANIRSLEEAWDKCPRSDWLAWMFYLMEPEWEEEIRFREIIPGSPPSAIRRKIKNPWVMENWKKSPAANRTK